MPMLRGSRRHFRLTGGSVSVTTLGRLSSESPSAGQAFRLPRHVSARKNQPSVLGTQSVDSPGCFTASRMAPPLTRARSRCRFGLAGSLEAPTAIRCRPFKYDVGSSTLSLPKSTDTRKKDPDDAAPGDVNCWPATRVVSAWTNHTKLIRTWS